MVIISGHQIATTLERASPVSSQRYKSVPYPTAVPEQNPEHWWLGVYLVLCVEHYCCSATYNNLHTACIPVTCALAFSVVVKTPVDSHT